MRYAMMLLVAAMCMGQSCVPAATPKPDPLEVNDTLRRACGHLTDSEIRTVLIAIQADRDNGFSKQNELTNILNGCPNTQCSVCGSAIIEQIYRD